MPETDRTELSAATSLRDYPIEAIDALIAFAKTQDDGCVAHSSEFRDGKPAVTVLVASTANPERAATSRLSPRAMLHRWAFMVMCWAGGVTIAVTWHGRTADWIGGMVYGIGIGRLILRDD